jgi:hypothetical protein
MPSGNQCWQWQKRCKLVQILQHQNLKPSLSLNQNPTQDEEFSRIVIDLPWPIKDRDFVFHSRLMVNTKLQTTIISLDSITDFYPADSHYIRGQANISYAIKHISDSSSLLTIHMHTDFAGSLSPSIINAMLIDELYEDIKKLSVLLAKD